MLHEGPWTGLIPGPDISLCGECRMRSTGLALDQMKPQTQTSQRRLSDEQNVISCNCLAGRLRPQALRLRRTASRLRGLTAQPTRDQIATDHNPTDYPLDIAPLI